MQQVQPQVSTADRLYPANLPIADVGVVYPPKFFPRPDETRAEKQEPSGNHLDERQHQLVRLLHGVTQGSHQAFASFYDLTLSRVTNVVNAIIFNQPDRDEVIGDVYLKIWKLSSDYRPGRGSVLAWLTVITRSRALDCKRRQTRLTRNELVFSQMEITSYDEVREPQDLHEIFQSGAFIEHLIERLPPVQKKIITLVYFEGLSHSEVASLIALPLGTVKSHVRRTLKKLRDQLEE